ncbi:MAG: DNA mismatch repair protein MutS [Proteobacteria bacterium]|nr:DNA mismatch repair protein MutS [Pseudomonadota bacterium]MBU1710142.1 DNA mismatch repair protein MutS [Pseudomonadota bacterium]
MDNDKLIIDLNYRKQIINEQLEANAFDSYKMFDLLSETVLDKRTLLMIEIHDLYKSINHTRTMVGAARLFHSLHSPLDSIDIIHAKQESLMELEANHKLRDAVHDLIEKFSDQEKDLFKLLNVNYLPIFPYRTLKRAVKAMETLISSVENIPQPETIYLDSLVKIIKNYGKTEESRLVSKPTFRTFDGIKTRDEKHFYTPALRFRPGWLSFGAIAPSIPLILSLGAGIFGFIDYAVAKSLVLLTGGGVLLGGVYAFLLKPFIDDELAILPIRQRLISSDYFTSTIEAVACLDELLSFIAFQEGIPHDTVIPEITNQERHYFVAKDLMNPIIAKNDKNYVGNDVNLDGVGLTFITGPNSGGKTTFCKTIAQNQLLGQIGSPIVASSAQMNVADKIVYQAPAFDSLSDPEGRFGTELKRTRDIFFDVTPKSLAILDEIAEGTTMHERLPVSAAILNGFYAKVTNTILVTHNYELVEMFQEMNRGQALQVEFKDNKPTHRIIPGISRDSHAEIVVKKLGFTPEDIQQHLRKNGYI